LQQIDILAPIPSYFLGQITPKQSLHLSKINSLSYDKVGVVIFRMFAADWQFGTHPMLFLGVKLL